MNPLALTLVLVATYSLMAAVCVLGRNRADGPSSKHRPRRGVPAVHIPAQREAPEIEQLPTRRTT